MATVEKSGWRELEEGAPVWFHEYRFAKSATANCLIARMPSSELLVLSPALGLTPEAFEAVDALGKVGAVVATNGYHYLGVLQWRERYPEALYFAPSASIPRIRKKKRQLADLTALDELSPMLGEGIIVREAPATKCGECWAMIRTGSGYVWFVSDILANIPELPKNLLLNLLFKWTKSAPGYRVFHLALQVIARDKKALLRRLLDDLVAFPPSVVLPAHGAPVKHAEVAAQTRALIEATL